MALSNDFRAMVQDISASYDVRKGELSALRHQMHKMLDEFRKEKKEEFKKLGDERRKEISDIKQRVSDLKHDLKASLQEFRKTTFAEIHKGAEERKEEVSHALNTFRKEVLNTFRHEREDMASSWQELVASMKEKRAGKEPGHYEKTGPEKAVHEKKAHHKNRKAAKTRH